MTEERTARRGKWPEKALSAAFVRQVKEPGRYSDGHGLYLQVDPTGAKRWVQRIAIRGKRSDLGLGAASLVPLAEARGQQIYRKTGDWPPRGR